MRRSFAGRQSERQMNPSGRKQPASSNGRAMSLQAEMNPRATEGQSGSMVGQGMTGMMGGGQMGHMMQMMQAAPR